MFKDFQSHNMVANPLEQAKLDRDHIANALESLVTQRDQLISFIQAKHPDIDLRTIDFSQKDRLNITIEKLIARDPSALEHLEALKDRASSVLNERKNLTEASETLGLQAAQDHVTRLGETVLDGTHGRKGPGIFDLVTASSNAERPFLHFFEAKGGNGSLGSRLINGLREQQGTTEYMRAIARRDPAVQEWLANNKHLLDGQADIRYTLVAAKPDGSVSATEFFLAPTDWKDLLP